MLWAPNRRPDTVFECEQCNVLSGDLSDSCYCWLRTRRDCTKCRWNRSRLPQKGLLPALAVAFCLFAKWHRQPLRRGRIVLVA